MSDKLAAKLRESPLKHDDIVRALAEQGCMNANGKPYDSGMISRWGSGKNGIPEHIQTSLNDILDALPKEKTNFHLEQAVTATSIHSALKELRLSLHMTYDEFAEALTPHLPAGIAPSAPTIVYWETEPSTGKKSALPSRRIFAGTDPITAYGDVFRQCGLGEWFDTHKEHFNQLLLAAMVSERKAPDSGPTNRWNTSNIQRDRPSFWDEYLAKRAAAAAKGQER